MHFPLKVRRGLDKGEHGCKHGALGEGLIKANVTEDEKVLEIALVSPDMSNYLSWKIPV